MRLRIPLCWTAFVVAVASFLVPALASGASASSRVSVSRVIQADVVSGSTSYCEAHGFGPNGGGCARMQPNTLDANDGDVVRICNRSKVIVPLFTLSVHNSLAGGKASTLDRGACLELTVHNPTDKTYEVRLFSEIEIMVGLKINVASPHPSAPVEPQPAAPLESIAGTWAWSFAPAGQPLATNGTVTFSNDGTMAWSGGSAGTWKHAGATVTLTWTSGTSAGSVDTMMLSGDEMTMTGHNNTGVDVMGVKQ